MLITQGSLVRVQLDPPVKNSAEYGVLSAEAVSLLSTEHSELSTEFKGGLAQLGEHLLCKQGVNGSIPLASTNTSQ